MWNDVGFGAVYVAWGAAVVFLGWAIMAATAWRDPDEVLAPWLGDHRRVRLALVLAWMTTLAGLFLPWIEGWRAASPSVLIVVVESGWVGLDPFSTTTLVALGGMSTWLGLRPGLAGAARPWVLIGMATAGLGLVGANVLIQATTTRGSHLRWGAWATLAASVVTWILTQGLLSTERRSRH